MNLARLDILAGLCIVGGVVLAALDKDPVQVASLVGLAGTICGRSRGNSDAGADETVDEDLGE